MQSRAAVVSFSVSFAALAVACGPEPGHSGGSEASSDDARTDDAGGGASTGAEATRGEPSDGEDATGTGAASDGTTAGTACDEGPPIDTRGFVPQTIAVDRGPTGADPLGDINGDGLGDFVIDGMVVFGREDHEPIAASDIVAGVGGIAFEVGTAAVANAGDVNMDGVTDLLVGDPIENFGEPNEGRVYVLFGKTDTTPWDVTAIVDGQAGLVIDGVGGAFGVGGAGVGDLDGDGFGDFVISAPAQGDGKAQYSGRVYGVFGSETTGVHAEAEVGRSLRGWRIDGPAPQAFLGQTIKALGDLNGDGVPDYALTVAQPQARVLVVFGHDAPPDLDGIAAGIGGYTVESELESPFPFDTGDVNGDGLMDVILGTNHGVHVAYGKADTAAISAADLDAGLGGFAVVAPEARGQYLFPRAVGFAGDIDGDGHGDLVLSHPIQPGVAGRAYFVLGACRPTATSLDDIVEGIGGFVVDGEPGEELGTTVAGIGDIDGDGFDDAFLSGIESSWIVLGAPLG